MNTGSFIERPGELYAVYVFVESMNEWADDCYGSLLDCITHVAGEIELGRYTEISKVKIVQDNGYRTSLVLTHDLTLQVPEEN